MAKNVTNGVHAVSGANGVAAMTNGNSTGNTTDVIDDAAVDTTVIAWEWAGLLARTGYVAADRTAIVAELRRWTIRLVEALADDAPAATPGTELGHALVQMGYASPAALGCTTALVVRRFAATQPERAAELVSTISQGFVRAVRDKTLEEQDAIRSSALLALERARAEQRQAELRDPVTGLPNRRGFVVALNELLASSPPGVLGVCLLTLGGFEPLDRGFGPAVGDQLLRTVTERLAARFGGSDELIAKVGREEFIVAAIGVKTPGQERQENVTQRVAAAQEAVRAPISLGDRSVVLSPSVGVVSRPTGNADPETMLRDVGLAGSWARDRGTGSIALFEVERAARQVAGLTLAAELPAAIDSGRLLAHYQPIVGLRSGRVEMVEALARWEHERLGLLEPDAFIPLAQRAGLIQELGRSVLERACGQSLAWHDDLARGPVISVNLDPRQLTEQSTVRDVVTVLDRTGLPAHLLQLEITENAALGDPAAQAVIRDLAHVGVGLALDDFGTGKAHLARLAELPGMGVRTLKLAGDFLSAQRPVPSPAQAAPARLTSRLFGPGRHSQQPVQGSARRDVLASTIALAHRLGMQVTVEGVETAQDEALVTSLGADHAQGSYYSVPLPPAEAGDYLSR
ncbi:GGDEF domain-containing protein [Kineosporia sp. J2-2]|uniref:GGDEF domain-containing protein n=1 Tax=Kineosporia corallincola TaxID=2835133 RepID=A0ABS5TF15_9ACTN|nr:bifunctional diguanylate cyclase/phosphodiesterase [Kineosporia corallincola]MBT0769680.1 GGDEF domain-containing protein [Kineosporia corallincola]